MKTLEYWREILISVLGIAVFILGFTLAFITGRGHESDYVQRIMVDESVYIQRIIIERQRLLQLKQQTNRLLNQVDWNEQGKQTWKTLGYVFPDSVRQIK